MSLPDPFSRDPIGFECRFPSGRARLVEVSSGEPDECQVGWIFCGLSDDTVGAFRELLRLLRPLTDESFLVRSGMPSVGSISRVVLILEPVSNDSGSRLFADDVLTFLSDLAMFVDEWASAVHILLVWCVPAALSSRALIGYEDFPPRDTGDPAYPVRRLVSNEISFMRRDEWRRIRSALSSDSEGLLAVHDRLRKLFFAPSHHGILVGDTLRLFHYLDRCTAHGRLLLVPLVGSIVHRNSPVGQSMLLAALAEFLSSTPLHERLTTVSSPAGALSRARVPVLPGGEVRRLGARLSTLKWQFGALSLRLGRVFRFFR